MTTITQALHYNNTAKYLLAHSIALLEGKGGVKFNPSDHPRGPGGKFVKAQGTGGGAEAVGEGELSHGQQAEEARKARVAAMQAEEQEAFKKITTKMGAEVWADNYANAHVSPKLKTEVKAAFQAMMDAKTKAEYNHAEKAHKAASAKLDAQKDALFEVAHAQALAQLQPKPPTAGVSASAKPTADNPAKSGKKLTPQEKIQQKDFATLFTSSKTLEHVAQQAAAYAKSYPADQQKAVYDKAVEFGKAKLNASGAMEAPSNATTKPSSFEKMMTPKTPQQQLDDVTKWYPNESIKHYTWYEKSDVQNPQHHVENANRKFWNGEPMTAVDKAVLQRLDHDVATQPKHSGKVYRYMGVDAATEKAMLQKLAGASIAKGDFQFAGFASSSKGKETPEDFSRMSHFKGKSGFMFHIEAKGKNGHDIEEVSSIRREREVLFRPTARFRVTKIEKAAQEHGENIKHIVHLEEY